MAWRERGIESPVSGCRGDIALVLASDIAWAFLRIIVTPGWTLPGGERWGQGDEAGGSRSIVSSIDVIGSSIRSWEGNWKRILLCCDNVTRRVKERAISSKMVVVGLESCDMTNS